MVMLRNPYGHGMVFKCQGTSAIVKCSFPDAHSPVFSRLLGAPGRTKGIPMTSVIDPNASPNAAGHEELQQAGFTVLKRVIAPAAIADTRRTILTNSLLLRNTRPAPSAGHLAGFHRFAELEPLHSLLSCNQRILSVLREATKGSVCTIGLSDITVNRSQGWHRDLLRGSYRSYVDADLIWSDAQGVLFKALLYLQDSSSLRLIAGSHRCRCSLDSDFDSEPTAGDTILTPSVQAGDVVLMDLRMSHCGSDDNFFTSAAVQKHPKILVSTVFGAVNSPVTQQMELGNAIRQADWMKRNWPRETCQLAEAAMA